MGIFCVFGAKKGLRLNCLLNVLLIRSKEIPSIAKRIEVVKHLTIAKKQIAKAQNAFSHIAKMQIVKQKNTGAGA